MEIILGDVEGQDLLERLADGQHRVGEFVDAVLLGALGNAHGNDLRGQDQDVPALQGAVLSPVIPLGRVLVDRVVLENEFSKQGLPVPRHRVHPVEGNAGADGGEGVTGEIQVGHGVDEEGIVLNLSSDVACDYVVMHRGTYHWRERGSKVKRLANVDVEGTFLSREYEEVGTTEHYYVFYKRAGE